MNIRLHFEIIFLEFLVSELSEMEGLALAGADSATKLETCFFVSNVEGVVLTDAGLAFILDA